MKSVIRICFPVLVLFLLSGNLCFGQPNSTTPADTIAAKEAMALKGKLNLSDSQTGRIQKAYRAHLGRKSNFQMLHLDSSARREGNKRLIKKYRDDVRKILTPSQFVAYRALIIQRRNSFRQYAQQRGLNIKEIED